MKDGQTCPNVCRSMKLPPSTVELVYVINGVSQSAYVGWFIDCKSMRGVNNIKLSLQCLMINVYAGCVDCICDSCNMVVHSTIKMTCICWQLAICLAVYVLWHVGTETPHGLIYCTVDSLTFTSNCLCTYVMCCKWAITSDTKVSLKVLTVSAFSGTATYQ